MICNFLLLFIQYKTHATLIPKRRFSVQQRTRSFRSKLTLNGSLSLVLSSFFFRSCLIREVRLGQRLRSQAFIRIRAENHCDDDVHRYLILHVCGCHSIVKKQIFIWSKYFYVVWLSKNSQATNTFREIFNKPTPILF